MKTLATLKDVPDDQPVSLAVNGEEVPSQLLSFDLTVATLTHEGVTETTLDVDYTTGD